MRWETDHHIGRICTRAILHWNPKLKQLGSTSLPRRNTMLAAVLGAHFTQTCMRYSRKARMCVKFLKTTSFISCDIWNSVWSKFSHFCTINRCIWKTRVQLPLNCCFPKKTYSFMSRSSFIASVSCTTFSYLNNAHTWYEILLMNKQRFCALDSMQKLIIFKNRCGEKVCEGIRFVVHVWLQLTGWVVKKMTTRIPSKSVLFID